MASSRLSRALCLSLSLSIAFAKGSGTIGASCDDLSMLKDCLDLTCLENTCQLCESDAQCREGEDTTYQACGSGKCATKKLFDGFLWQDGVASALIFTSGVLAAGAGIGGGGLYVPIFLIFGWGKAAVVRSLAATTGLAMALMILVARQRHPEANRPAVDYRAILLLEPIVLLGTIPGKMLNEILPPVIIYVLLLLLLVTVTVRCWQKYFKYRLRDQKRLAEEEESAVAAGGATPGDAEAGVEMVRVEGGDDESETASLSPKRRRPPLAALKTTFSSSVSENERIERKLTSRHNTVTKESRNPTKTIALLVLCWVLLLAIACVVKMGTDCGSLGFWLLHVAYVPVLWSFSLVYGIVMGRKHKRKEEMEFEWVVGDILWTKQRIIMYPIAFFFAGLLASLLGIGGGMVIAPLLLEIGMHPIVANATTGAMTLFTASSATIQYLIQDASTFDYFLWYMSVAFIAGLIGRFVVSRYIERTGKQSLAVLFLAVLITGACAMTVYIAIARIVKDVDNNIPIELAPLCDS